VSSRVHDASDAPERDLAEAPEPERVRTARKARPVKRDATAAKERQRKRDYRARVREEEQAAPQPSATAAEAKPIEAELNGHETTPEQAGQILGGLMAASATFLRAPELELTDDEQAKLGKALAPVINKYGVAMVGAWAMELHALAVTVAILKPKFESAFMKPAKPAADRPTTGMLTPVRTEGGPSDAAATA
jgi:hypothetical protein